MHIPARLNGPQMANPLTLALLHNIAAILDTTMTPSLTTSSSSAVLGYLPRLFSRLFKFFKTLGYIITIISSLPTSLTPSRAPVLLRQHHTSHTTLPLGRQMRETSNAASRTRSPSVTMYGCNFGSLITVEKLDPEGRNAPATFDLRSPPFPSAGL